MGEALKKVTQELGLNENRGKTDLNPSEGALEKALKEEEDELAREMRVGRAEESIAKRQVRVAQLRNLLGKGGIAMTDEERRDEERQRAEEELKEKAERIAQAKALYTSCIEAGGDPKRCAEMVAGLIPSPAAGVTAPPPTSVTDLINALVQLDQLRGSDKGLAELKASFDKLADEIKQGNISRQPLDPVAFAREQAQQIKATYEAMKEMGVIREPEVRTEGGESLEVVKEKHRHEEKMEEVRGDREYKKDITKIASEVPERIGRGIAGQLGEEEGGRGSTSGELEYITCQEEGCGAKIYITPDTGSQVTCPKCGTIYSRKGTVETK